MSPDPPSAGPNERVFGRTPSQAARAAVLLALMGCGAVWYVDRLLTRKGSPLGEALLALGLPPGAAFGAGVLCVVGIAGYGYWRATRGADRFHVTPGGLEIRGSLGRFRVEWSNVAAVGITAAGSLGIRLRDRERLLRTHQGTSQQREWLRTMPPYGEWDLLYPQADLGHPAAEVLSWMRSYLPEGY